MRQLRHPKTKATWSVPDAVAGFWIRAGWKPARVSAPTSTPAAVGGDEDDPGTDSSATDTSEE